MVDQFRAAGLNVQLIHGEEGGKEIGKRPEPDEGIDLMKPCVLEADFSVMRRKR
jgi:hypothetical protein